MNDALLDANTLIAPHDQSHADEDRAREFIGGLNCFSTCPQTQGAFLRFFTRPWRDREGFERPPRLTMGAAIERLSAILESKKHRFFPDNFSFTDVSMRSLSGFKQWNDAYLIAKAAKRKVRLATLERKLENMDHEARLIVFQLP